MDTIRDRERRYRGVGGSFNRPAQVPRRAPKRVKIPPAPAIPCRVKNSQGEYYHLDPVLNLLFINPNFPEGHLFPSRHKASRRVWKTIERLKAELIEWEEKDFVLENVR